MHTFCDKPKSNNDLEMSTTTNKVMNETTKFIKKRGGLLPNPSTLFKRNKVMMLMFGTIASILLLNLQCPESVSARRRLMNVNAIQGRAVLPKTEQDGGDDTESEGSRGPGKKLPTDKFGNRGIDAKEEPDLPDENNASGSQSGGTVASGVIRDVCRAVGPSRGASSEIGTHDIVSLSELADMKKTTELAILKGIVLELADLHGIRLSDSDSSEKSKGSQASRRRSPVRSAPKTKREGSCREELDCRCCNSSEGEKVICQCLSCGFECDHDCCRNHIDNESVPHDNCCCGGCKTKWKAPMWLMKAGPAVGVGAIIGGASALVGNMPEETLEPNADYGSYLFGQGEEYFSSIHWARVDAWIGIVSVMSVLASFCVWIYMCWKCATKKGLEGFLEESGLPRLLAQQSDKIQTERSLENPWSRLAYRAWDSSNRPPSNVQPQKL